MFKFIGFDYIFMIISGVNWKRLICFYIFNVGASVYMIEQVKEDLSFVYSAALWHFSCKISRWYKYLHISWYMDMF